MDLENQRSASLSKNSEWLEISMDSLCCVAGERLSGEILLHLANNTRNLSIILKSRGIEHVKVQEPNGILHEHTSNIYTLNTTISEFVELGKVQSIWPFTFKLPLFSPASFNFTDTDNQGNSIKCQVCYEIEAILCSETDDVIKCKKKFFVLNRNTRKVLNGEISEETPLSCCWCCTQGMSKISLGYIDLEHMSCGATKNYRIDVQSQLNRKLESLMGQVMFKLYVQIPNGKIFEFMKVLSRTVPQLNAIFDGNADRNSLTLEFEVDLSQANFGENPCSNDCALFGAEYYLQFYATYDVGCRSKRAFSEMELHINPVAPVKEALKLPGRWDPKENLISNLILEASNGIPYPQGTVLSNRNRINNN
ncbi:hypothetical protein SteCoe_32594 [Stentor coeruleus]|uniref:Arrestin-like N-terminal domain-containing protein n=1 Tax=Stentor coeruleus TaxID=5963 RepID=A0A1R2AZ37_9CILI|nr:hypothetical protein SteCoe_32594 [Stentor coeruleus]